VPLRNYSLTHACRKMWLKQFQLTGSANGTAAEHVTDVDVTGLNDGRNMPHVL